MKLEDERKQILVIMYQNFSQEFGATRKYSEMMEYLHESLDIIFVCSKKSNHICAKKIYEVPVLPPQKKDLNNKSISFMIFWYVLFYISQVIVIHKVLIENRQLKFVHLRHDTYSIPSAILLRIYGKKVIADGKIFSSYALKYDKRLRLIGKPIIFIEKLVLKTYWKFYVYSSNYKKELVDYGLSADKLFYIPSSINLKKIPFYPLNNSSIFNICYFGELHDYSNVSTLIEAHRLILKSFPESLLYIVGSGECYESLVNLTKQLCLVNNVIFTGHLHTSELFEYFAKFSILVNPTKMFSGALSTKRIEAAAAGKVIFESMPENNSESAEYVEKEKGIIYFDGDDPEELSHKICCLFRNTELILEYSKKSLELSQKYDVKNYDKLLSIIQEDKE